MSGLVDGPDTEDELTLRLRGWRLTTAEVLYYMPDHPVLLQTFVWQTLDLSPAYPRIRKFLDFWRREVDAVIHEVRLGTGELLAPAPIRRADAIFHH